jgi:hypothetical protein
MDELTTLPARLTLMEYLISTHTYLETSNKGITLRAIFKTALM